MPVDFAEPSAPAAAAAPERAAAAPTVSVIMPAYNSQRYVGQTVRSILGQTFRDFEFVIVDDGSTDNTLKILQQFAAKDPRIILISRPNTGIVGACRDALARARGEFVARTDADDVAMPTKLERQVAYFREHPECVACGTFVETIDPYNGILDRLVHQTEHEAIDRELMGGRGFAMVNPTVMMRHDALRRVGGYRKQYETAEDLDLFLRLAEVGKLHNIPEYLLQYRQHYESVNRTKHDLQRNMKRGMMEEAYARRGVPMPEGIEFKRSYPPPKFEQTCNWGWRALRCGNRYAARRHAIDALKMHPLKPAAWKLAVCAARGH